MQNRPSMVQYLRFGSFSALLSITSALCGFGGAAVVPAVAEVVAEVAKVGVGSSEITVAFAPAPPSRGPSDGLPPSAVAAAERTAPTARNTHQFRMTVTILDLGGTFGATCSHFEDGTRGFYVGRRVALIRLFDLDN